MAYILKTKRVVLFIGLAAIVAFIGSSFPVMAASKQVLFRYQSRGPQAHLMSQGVMKFVQAVEARTNGRYKVEQYFAAQLYKDPDIPQVLGTGVLDMGDALSIRFSKIVREALIVSGLCGLGKSASQFHRALDGKLGELLDKEFQKKANIKVIAWTELGGTDGIVCKKKQIRTIEDFKGLLIRAPGPANMLFLKDVEASPADISSAEVYTALQYGTIDGAITAMDSVVKRKFHEVAPNVTWAFIGYTMSTGLAMNLDKWNTLPPDIQKIFLESGKLATEYTRTHSWNVKTEAVKFLKAQPKVHFYEVPKKEFSAWQEKVLPSQIKLLKKVTGAQRATELLDILDSYR